MTACPQTAPVHRAHWDSTKGRIREIQTGGLERPSRGKWEPDVKKTGRGHDPGATLGTCPCLVKGKILVKGKLPPKTFSRHRETGSGQGISLQEKKWPPPRCGNSLQPWGDHPCPGPGARNHLGNVRASCSHFMVQQQHVFRKTSANVTKQLLDLGEVWGAHCVILCFSPLCFSPNKT